ncbi:hypothetical protein ACFQ3B_21230 [Stackebrandtia endophytica]|nr:hypothetical protein [Stackebrandtia endophytica]
MVKRGFVALVAAALAWGLVACGGSGGGYDNETESPQDQQSEQTGGGY